EKSEGWQSTSSPADSGDGPVWKNSRSGRRTQPCEPWLSILYLKRRVQRERVRRSLCQRQSLLQKRKLPRKMLRQSRKISCRWKVQITLNFTSVTPSRRRIFTRARLVFSRWPTVDRKPA